MNKENIVSKPKGFPMIFTIILVLALAFIAFNAYSLFSNQTNLPAGVPPALPPVVLTVNCTECMPLAQLIAPILPDARQVAFESSEGQALAQQYSITKLPALIVYNSTQAQDPQLAPLVVQRQNAFILEPPTPPFFDVASRAVKGIVTLTAVTPLNCSQCFNASLLSDELKNNRVAIEFQEFQEGSRKATELIALYNLTFLPVYIFSQDVLDYPQLNQSLNPLMTSYPDGFRVLSKPTPPVKNLSNGKIEGLVEVTYLTDINCTQCYNVSLHRNVLAGYNVFIVNETTIDLNTPEGQALVTRYNVTAVPTMLLSKAAQTYYALLQLWAQVGTIEGDGTMVFRNFEAVPGLTYRDLANGSIVSVPQTS